MLGHGPDSQGIEDIVNKLEENRMRWLGHAVRREQEHKIRVVRAGEGL